MNEKSDLEKYFRSNKGRLINKQNNYFDVYERHFSRYRNTSVIILEIGVSQGVSLQMWKSYFGENSKIYGIDIEPRCKELEEKNIEIFIGSQSDRKFLKEVKEKIGQVDILIDDGGHTMKQQIISFEELFGIVKKDGIYLCEDLHTSYWLLYGGGYKRKGTFIEYSKNFIDFINAYHSEQKNLKVNDFTKAVDSIHFYDGIVVIEKKEIKPSFAEKTGNPSIINSPLKVSNLRKVASKIKYILLRRINKILRWFKLPGFIWR
jgi:hypothetical protein